MTRRKSWLAALVPVLALTGGVLGAPSGAATSGGAEGPAAGAAAAGELRLVHDFFPGELQGSPPPQDPLRLGRFLFFIAEDRDRAAAVWRSDGTPAAAAPVPLADGEAAPGSPARLGRVGNRMVWTATSPDGLATFLYSAGPRGAAIRLPTHPLRVDSTTATVRGRLYLLACQEEGCALWSTDGTAAGTAAVPGAGDALPAADVAILGTFADRWVVVRRGAAVVAWDVEAQRPETLLATGAYDPAAYPLAEVLLLVNRWPAPKRLFASRLAAPRGEQLFVSPDLWVAGWTDERFYFVAGADSYGENGHLWSTDGSRAGTRRYSGFAPEAYSFLADRLGTLADTTFLPMPGSYMGALMATDESAGRLRALRHTCDSKYSCWASSQSNVSVAGDLGFLTIDGKLVQSDGSRAGTRAHDRLDTAVAASLRVAGGDLLVGARSRDGVDGLWETDGRHTRLLSDPAADRQLRVAGQPVPLGDGWVVSGAVKGHGLQLWRVAAGTTTALTALRHLGSGIYPRWAAGVGDRRVVEGSDVVYGVGPTGPAELLPFHGPDPCYPTPTIAGCSSSLVRAGGRLLLSSARGLWATDSTAAGSLQLGVGDGTGPFLGGSEIGAYNPLVGLGPLGGTAGDEALAVGEDGWLWRSDGTAAGTIAFLRLPPAGERGTHLVGPPVAVGEGTLFLRRVPAELYTSGVLELWRTDGTAAGTLHLADVPFSADTFMVTSAAVVGERLFFRLDGVLWTSDGTPSGTHPLAEQPPGGTMALAAGATLLYAAAGSFPTTLWAIDAQTLQAREVTKLDQLSADVYSDFGEAVGDVLLFQADGAWWITAGDAASTRRLPDAVRSNVVQLPVAAGGRRFYPTCDAAHGCELWSLDVHGGDHRLEVDLWPGPRDGRVRVLATVDGGLLFGGTDPDLGDELWELRFASSP